MLPKGKEKYKVILTRLGLFYNVLSNSATTYTEKSIQISDIVGCHRAPKNGHVVSRGGRKNSSRNNSESENEPINHNTNGVSGNSLSSRSQSFSDSILTAENDDSNSLPVPSSSEPGCGFVVFAYPFKTKMFSRKRVRQRLVVGFEIRDQEESKEGTENEILKWMNAINCLCRNLPIDISGR